MAYPNTHIMYFMHIKASVPELWKRGLRGADVALGAIRARNNGGLFFRLTG